MSDLVDRLEWMDEARQIAAQCWCDPETEQKIMDPVLAEAIAKRIALWMATGSQHATNEEYWRKRAADAEEAIAALRSEPVAACHHEPYQGRCIHCDIPFKNGKPLPAAPSRETDQRSATKTQEGLGRLWNAQQEQRESSGGKGWEFSAGPGSNPAPTSGQSKTGLTGSHPDAPTPTAEPALSAEQIEEIRKQWDGDMYPCNAEFYALCDMALSSLTANSDLQRWQDELINARKDALTARDEGIEAAAKVAEKWNAHSSLPKHIRALKGASHD